MNHSMFQRFKAFRSQRIDDGRRQSGLNRLINTDELALNAAISGAIMRRLEYLFNNNETVF